MVVNNIYVIQTEFSICYSFTHEILIISRVGLVRCPKQSNLMLLTFQLLLFCSSLTLMCSVSHIISITGRVVTVRPQDESRICLYVLLIRAFHSARVSSPEQNATLPPGANLSPSFGILNCDSFERGHASFRPHCIDASSK